ncbi:hypothetical protein FOZ63_030118 [Perkinsus olseni]|uniref:Reverse transcriptase domain-containing protein n=1 Tax=Perkinsus olseni TaxID=32597 RepID=A0A7J6TB64_PEROL|nr:hypothetical protein FOZ63_030118 [Perkinsus olseni]
MPKHNHHPRSEQGRIRRAAKERTRRALRRPHSNSSPLTANDLGSACGEKAVRLTHKDLPSSNIDEEGLKLYKRAMGVAAEEYNRRREKLTDGTGASHAVEWGPLSGDPDPLEDLDRDQATILALQEALNAAVGDILGSNVRPDIDKWLNLTRDQQGEHQEIWDGVRTAVTERAKTLREECYELTGVDERLEKGPQKLRAALLKGLLVSTGSLADPDDVELLDEILEKGGVGVGIEKKIRPTGRWPRLSVDEDGDPVDVNHGASGLSQFALDSWKNYESAATLEAQARAYLMREVEIGNMEVTQGIPAGGVVSKIAAIEKRPGEKDSPIRVIDDLRRSGVNAMVKSEETLQLPGLLTTAYLIRSHRQNLKGASAGPKWNRQVFIEVDCAAAYRNVPIQEAERKFCMNFIPPKGAENGLLICHTRLPFGLRPSGLLWVRVYSGLVLVLKRLVAYSNGEGVQVYIDDLNYITTDDQAAPRLIAILLLHEVVGIDLSYHKIRVSTTPVILGFQWDLERGEVKVTRDRQQKLASQIQPVVDPRKKKAVSTHDLQAIAGRAAWMSQIICQFRSRLRPLYGRLGIARRKNLRGINLSVEAVECLQFILETLERPARIGSNTVSLLGAGCLTESEGPVGVVISDASTYSIAAVIMLPYASYWFWLSSSDARARTLVNRSIGNAETAEWISGDISSLELIGALMGASLLPPDSPGLLLCDNISAVNAVNHAAGRAVRMNQIVMTTSQNLAFGRGLKASHIPTKENWLVDKMSRTRSIGEVRKMMEGSSFREVDGLYLLERLFA